MSLNRLEEFLLDANKQSEEEIRDALAKDWTRLLRGIRPGYGPPPPYEGVYRRNDGIGIEIIQEVSAIYSQHGVGLDKDVFNRPDYIGVEFDFLNYLAEIESETWLSGQESEALKLKSSYEDFLDLHVGVWVPEFCLEAEKEAQTLFYQALIMITKGFMDETIQAQ